MGCHKRNNKQHVFGCLIITVQLAHCVRDFCVKADCLNSPLHISAGLVCGANLSDNYQYLQVIEGNVITIDNGYILVLKE